MTPVTSSPSRLEETRLSAPSGKPSRTKRDLHLITFPQIPSFSGNFPSQSAKTSLITSVNSTSLMRDHCCPRRNCRRSFRTPLVASASISSCELRLLVSWIMFHTIDTDDIISISRITNLFSIFDAIYTFHLCGRHRITSTSSTVRTANSPFHL